VGGGPAKFTITNTNLQLPPSIGFNWKPVDFSHPKILEHLARNMGAVKNMTGRFGMLKDPLEILG